MTKRDEKVKLLKKAKKMLKDFKRIKDGTSSKFKNEYGLCENLKSLNVNLAVYYRTWKHYSGVETFPVPHKYENPQYKYIDTLNLYKGKYGKKRKSLLKHIIRSLDAELK